MLFPGKLNTLELINIFIGISSGVAYFLTYHTIALYVLIVCAICAILLIGIHLFLERKHDFKMSNHQIKIVLSSNGIKSKYNMTSTIHCLKGGLTTVPYSIECEGTCDNLREGMGRKISVQKSGLKYLITIAIGKSTVKKEVIKLNLSGNLTNTFLNVTEYWDLYRYYKSDSVQITIEFPRNRPCKGFYGYKIRGHHKVLHKVQPVLHNNNGRNTLEWDIQRPGTQDVYRIAWDW